LLEMNKLFDITEVEMEEFEKQLLLWAFLVLFDFCRGEATGPLEILWWYILF
jgi:hypothetical protein